MLRKKICKLTLIVAAVFVLLTAAFGFYFYSDGSAAEQILSAYTQSVQSVANEDGSLSYIGIVMNNLYACGLCIGLGLVPFLFLTAWGVISNCMVIGAVLGYGSASGVLPPFRAIVFGLLPHGIFELPAIFLSMAMGLYLCRTLSLKILGRAKEERIMPMLNAFAKTFVLVIVPLVVVAAVVECCVTPLLLEGMIG